MRKILLGLAGLVALLVAIVLVAPSFIDWTNYRNGIAAEIERALGRRVVIDGAVEASIVPTPRLSLHGARLGNLTGASSPYMAQAEAIELRVAFWPLLTGRLVVTSVVLRKPVIELELLPDGQRNWAFGRSLEDVQFEDAVVSDGTVIYRETRSGAEQRVEGINARFAADGLHGPLRAAGELRYKSVPLRFSLSTGRFDPRGQTATPVNLNAEVLGPARGLTRSQPALGGGNFTGSLRWPETGPQFDGQLKLRGDDLAELVGALGFGRAPDVLAQGFSLESGLALQDEVVSANGASLLVGDTRAQGAVNAAFTGDAPQIDVALTLGRVDIDTWLAAAAKKAASRPAESRAAPREPEEFELPLGIGLTLDVTADALTRRAGAARRVKLAAEMADGIIEIYQFSVQLPGGTDASFSGRLISAEGKPRVNGLAEIASDDFRSLLGWLDVDVSGLPAGRLNKVSATGHLGVTAEMLDVGDLDLRFDNTRVTGALVAALRERPAFGVNLIVDQFNLASYLPGAGAAGPQAAATETVAAEAAAAVANGTLLPGLLGRFDANLRLRVGQLALGTTTARGVNLDGTLANGTLTMRRLAVANLAGGAVTLSGTLDGFDDKLRTDLQFDVKADEPAGLLRAAGIALPLPEAALEPFAATGKLSGGDGAYKVDASLTAALAAIAVKGEVGFPAQGPAKAALDVALKHPSYVGLIRLFDGEFTPEQSPQAQAVDLTTRLERRGTDYSLADIRGALGPLAFDGGTFSLGLGEGLPRVTAQLTVGEIDTRHFLAAAARPPASRAPANAIAERWSSKPIDLDFARFVNGTLKIDGKSLRHGRWAVGDPKASLTLANGGIDLESLEGQLQGGKLALQLRLTPAGQQSAALALNYSVRVTGAGIGPALFGAPIDLSGGTFDLDLEGAATGASEAALIAGLSGKGAFTAENTTLKGFDLGRLDGRLPFVESPGEMVRLLQSSVTGGATRVTRLQADMTLANGVVAVDDLRIRSPSGNVSALVAADLPQWRLDATVQVRVADAPNAPPFALQLTGPLDAPRREIDSDALQAYLIEDMARRPALPRLGPPAAPPSGTLGVPGAPSAPVPRQPAAPAPSTPSAAVPRAPAPSPGGAVRTTEEPRVLQRSPNAPPADSSADIPAAPPPANRAVPGARVLQVSPNAAPPAAEQPRERPPDAPDPDAFTRQLLREFGQ